MTDRLIFLNDSLNEPTHMSHLVVIWWHLSPCVFVCAVSYQYFEVRMFIYLFIIRFNLDCNLTFKSAFCLQKFLDASVVHTFLRAGVVGGAGVLAYFINSLLAKVFFLIWDKAEHITNPSNNLTIFMVRENTENINCKEL